MPVRESIEQSGQGISVTDRLRHLLEPLAPPTPLRPLSFIFTVRPHVVSCCASLASCSLPRVCYYVQSLYIAPIDCNILSFKKGLLKCAILSCDFVLLILLALPALPHASLSSFYPGPCCVCYHQIYGRPWRTRVLFDRQWWRRGHTSIISSGHVNHLDGLFFCRRHKWDCSRPPLDL